MNDTSQLQLTAAPRLSPALTCTQFMFTPMLPSTAVGTVEFRWEAAVGGCGGGFLPAMAPSLGHAV